MRKAASFITTATLVLALGLAGCQADAGKPDAGPTGAGSATTTATKAAGTGAAGQRSADTTGASAADRAKAKDIVGKMGTAELAGSVIMATYDASDPQKAADLITDQHLAGVIVMGYNLPTKVESGAVKKVTSTIAEGAGDRGWPAAIGVDQEGGEVARLKSAATRYPPLMAAGAADTPKLTTSAYRGQADELQALGFTADFAPDADVTIGEDDPTINVRSAGSNPKRVSETVSAAVKGYNAGGIASSAKHYPGHGALTTDSHESLPKSKKSIKQMAGRDLKPFAAANKAQAPMVMVGHIALPGAGSTPASLNPDAYKALRDTTGYKGVAVTDALNMGAVKASNGQETVKALKAGADLALMPPDTQAAVTAVKKAIGDGSLSKKRVKEAATRVVAMQLWQQRRSAADKQSHKAARAAAKKSVAKLSDASVTVLHGKCRKRTPVKSISIVGGSDTGKANLKKAARKAGVKLGGDTTVGLGLKSGADVVLGTAGPWVVDSATADTVLELYSDGPAAMDAAMKYLTGDLRATGRAPVKVSGKAPTCAS